MACGAGLQLTGTGETLEQKPKRAWNTASVPTYENQTKELGLDTVQLLLGWFMYKLIDNKSAEAAYNK